jgi:hypothetical protein
MFERLLTVLRRRRVERELAGELEFHLERLEAEHRARGLSPDEAHRAARIDMGGLTRVVEEYRDRQRIPLVDTLWRNLRFGMRSLLRTPGVTLVVAITLAVGIGANAAIFAVVNGVLLEPLPFPDADSLVAVNHGMTGTRDELPSAPYLYFTYREESRSFDGIGLWQIRPANITSLERPEQVRVLFVTSEILPILRVNPMLGRRFSQQDDLPNAPPTVLLTYTFWQRRFGGDPLAVGRHLIVDGQAQDVIGVLPQGFRFLDNEVDIVAPFQLDRSQVTLGRYVFPSLARLRTGVTLDQASADITRMVPMAIERFPPPPGYTRERFMQRPVTSRLTPLKESVVGNSLLSGMLFGLLPILRYSNPRVVVALRTGGRTMSDTRERHRARAILVAVQVAIALVLLVSSGLMLRTFQALNRVDPGFVRPQQVQMARIAIPFGDVPEPERVTRMQEEILNRLRSVPGVASAAFADIAPLDPTNRGSDTVLFVDGRTYAPGQARPLRRFMFISPGFFQTLGTRIVAGRDLTWSDLYDRRLVALVSESLARDEWQSAARALGQRVRASPADPWREVIGVVGNVRDNGMHRDPPSIVYFPSLIDRFWSVPTLTFRSATFVIRSSRTGTESFLRDVHTAVWAVNSNLPLAGVRTLDEAYRKSLAATSFTLVLLAIAGVMGLLLGAIGIYGVIAYVVSQRTGEIGVRLALGARPRDVRRQFLREGMLLTAAGVIAGLAAAVLLTRVMSSLLFGVSRLDPVTYTLMTLVLILVAISAAYLPARRASRNDPMAALRAGG